MPLNQTLNADFSGLSGVSWTSKQMQIFVGCLVLFEHLSIWSMHLYAAFYACVIIPMLAIRKKMWLNKL